MCYAECAGWTACGKGDPGLDEATMDAPAVTCPACLAAMAEWRPMTAEESAEMWAAIMRRKHSAVTP